MPFGSAEKRREYARKYYREYNKSPKAKEYKKRWRKNNPEKTKKYSEKYRSKNPEERKRMDRIYHNKSLVKRKLEIFGLLGKKCIRCGFSDPRCLQIDHVKGGGCKEKGKFKNYNLYLKMVLEKIKSGSKDYQLLCANCNFIKRYSEMGSDWMKMFKGEEGR